MKNIKEDNMVVGAIQGRHEMPCTEFIFTGDIDPLDLNGIYEGVAEKLGNVESVVLYVTGLTVVTTTVIKYCVERNIALTLMHFDRNSNDYYPQVIIA